MVRESFAALPDPADHPVFRIEPMECTSKLLPMPGVRASEPGRRVPGSLLVARRGGSSG